MNFFNMSFFNGKTRFVIVIPCLNIALKVAHVHPIRAIKTVLWTVEHCMECNRQDRIKKMLAYSDEITPSWRWQFRGIYSNLREYRFFKESKNPFLWPTHFSLMGLINIQPLAEKQPLETKDQKLWSFMCKVTENKVCDDSHTFSEEPNYAIDQQGHLRILDYGSTRSQKVIAQYGDLLYTQSNQLF